MKAFVFKEKIGDLNYVCTKFDNLKERVTIFLDDNGLFHQHLNIGQVKYEKNEY